MSGGPKDVQGLTLEGHGRAHSTLHAEGNRIGLRIAVENAGPVTTTILLERDKVRALRDYLTSLLGDGTKSSDRSDEPGPSF